MYYPNCGIVHINASLQLIQKRVAYGNDGSGFLFCNPSGVNHNYVQRHVMAVSSFLPSPTLFNVNRVMLITL